MNNEIAVTPTHPARRDQLAAQAVARFNQLPESDAPDHVGQRVASEHVANTLSDEEAFAYVATSTLLMRSLRRIIAGDIQDAAFVDESDPFADMPVRANGVHPLMATALNTITGAVR